MDPFRKRWRLRPERIKSRSTPQSTRPASKRRPTSWQRAMDNCSPRRKAGIPAVRRYVARSARRTLAGHAAATGANRNVGPKQSSSQPRSASKSSAPAPSNSIGTSKHIRPTTRSKCPGSCRRQIPHGSRLDLPEGKQPQIEGGVVLESTQRAVRDKDTRQTASTLGYRSQPFASRQGCESRAPTASLPSRHSKLSSAKKSATVSDRAVSR